MKILGKDIRRGYVKFEVENRDDLWYLSHIIEKGDKLEGVTFRKIKIGDEENARVVRKRAFLAILVEKIEFHKHSDSLRALGTIVDGPEDVARGSYHTLSIEDNTTFSLNKEKFLSYQLEKLDEAAKPRKDGVIILVFDRETAIFALLKSYGFDVLAEISGDVQKKDNPETVKETFYKQIASLLGDYSAKYNATRIVIASPAFWKEYLMKELDEKLREKSILATCNDTGRNGINEVMKRPEVATALADDRNVKEARIVEELLSEIKKDGVAAYGFSETLNVVNMGAVKELIVSDSLIMQKRQSDTYGELDEMMKSADSMNGRISIISSSNDAGKKLDGLGGIGAILRYKVQKI